MGVYVGVNNRKITNSTCIFGSMSGLPPRVGVPVSILNNPQYALHCRATTNNNKCCCLPISHTWHLNCADARKYLIDHNLMSKTNQVYSGGVGNRILKMRM